MLTKVYKFVFAAAVILLVSCGYKVGYSLSGASIPPDAKSYSVAYFPNNATMVAPILSSEMTDALKSVFSRKTKLQEVSEGGDFAFEGYISNYTSTTAAVSSGTTTDYGSLNRLTITIYVKFTNALDEKYSFAKSFSAYEDYDSSKLLNEVEGDLITTLVEQLADDIFQASASNW